MLRGRGHGLRSGTGSEQKGKKQQEMKAGQTRGISTFEAEDPVRLGARHVCACLSSDRTPIKFITLEGEKGSSEFVGPGRSLAP